MSVRFRTSLPSPRRGASCLWLSLWALAGCGRLSQHEPARPAAAVAAPLPPPAEASTPAPLAALLMSHPGAVVLPLFPARRFVVTDFGARGTGVGNDTNAINAAIVACNAAGGGTVAFPPGTYPAASIELKSHVRLELAAGATLLALVDGYQAPEPNAFDAYQDFGHDHFRNALIWGENVTDVAIEGPGTIDGHALTGGDGRPGRGDKQIAIRAGQRLLFRGLHQVKGGHFFYLLTDCQNVTLEGLDLQGGRDGMDLVGCRNVNVHDTRILGCGDDTIALKSDYSMGRRLATENVSVWHATVESGCNGLQFGSETAGDFRNISFADVDILRAGKAGIGVQTNDGGIIENVSFQGIRIRRAANPIFVNSTRRLRTPENVVPGHVRNLLLRDITASEVVQTHKGEPPNAATISGLPGAPHEQILLENVSITYKGGGRLADGQLVPAYSGNYNPRALGPRPAYGFYCRHVKGLRFHDVRVGFEAEDLRPAFVVTDVDGLELDRVAAQRPLAVAGPALRLEGVRNLSIRRSAPLPTADEPQIQTAAF